MNTEQLKSVVRWIIATFGPFLIAHGYVSDNTLSLASGVLISLVPLVWSMFVHTDTNAIKVVDTIAKEPDSTVKAIITHATPEGAALASSLPGNTTVVAGSAAAASAGAKKP